MYPALRPQFRCMQAVVREGGTAVPTRISLLDRLRVPAEEPGFDDAMALLTDNVVAAILDDKSALDRFEPT
jgi:hypothetical protein